MSRLSNILPNEKGKEENELIAKYKAYKMDYLVHVRDKAEKENNSLQSCGYTLMFGAYILLAIIMLYSFLYLIPKAERIREIMPMTNSSITSAISVGMDAAYVTIAVFIVIIIGFTSVIVATYGRKKYGRACEFYDKVIDAKMEDEKLL